MTCQTRMDDIMRRLAEIVGITGARDATIRPDGSQVHLAISLQGMATPHAVLERFRGILERTGFRISDSSAAPDELRFTILA